MATKTTIKKTSKRTVKSSPVPATSAKKANMVKLAHFDAKGTPGTDMEIKKLVTKSNPRLVAYVLRGYQMSARQGTQSTKTRSEVIGSTRKIYRQKGTGRARHGSIKAPIFVGGGITFGPHPREFANRVPQKMRRAALIHLLSQKFQTNQASIVSGLKKVSGKTRDMHGLLAKMGLDKQKVLLILGSEFDNAARSARNLSLVSVRPMAAISARDVIECKHIILAEEVLPQLNAYL